MDHNEQRGCGFLTVSAALQCPACGFKHRLDALAGDPVFSCSSCGRLLKTPAEYRRADERGASAGASAIGDTGGAAPRRSANRTASSTPRERVPMPSQAGLPIRILAWVVAFVFGALFVRWFAKITGLLTGDSLLDMMTSTGWGRYVRVFLLLPVLALATAAFVTLFVEGSRWWIRMRNNPPVRTGMPEDARKAPVVASHAPAARSVNPAARTAVGAESDPTPSDAQRPRRIPRRDTIA